MKDYYEKSIRALQLAGMSERTQQCYTRSVRQIVDFYNKTPDLISEVELEDYFLHRQNKNQWSAATMRIAYCLLRHQVLFSKCSQTGMAYFYLHECQERKKASLYSEQERGLCHTGSGDYFSQLCFSFHGVFLRVKAFRGPCSSGFRHRQRQNDDSCP